MVLDPIDGLLPKTDTSIALINEARRRNIHVDTATIDALFFDSYAAVLATPAEGHEIRRKLEDYDLILMRKEPPYDLAFHYATQLLSLSKTLVINNPTALRDFNEKLIGLPFIQYMPPTLVASNKKLISDFLEHHQECVIKSLDSFQGKSVQKLSVTSEESPGIITSFTQNGSHSVMVQKFLDRVFEGDKRVIMLGEKVLGAAMRKPKTGFHANFANSDALETSLSPREREIVGILGPWMVSKGIHFSGLDFIDDQLTEINITCPTGIVQISELDGTDLTGEIVNYFKDLAQKTNHYGQSCNNELA